MRVSHSIICALAALSLVGGCKRKSSAPACPTTYKDLKGSGEQTCSCTGKNTGSVWGSDIYTEDSAICGAAIHAGVIDDKGGDVTVAETDGCDGYVGSAKHGVSSSDWGSYPKSFYFTKMKKPVCPPKPDSGGGVPLVPTK